MATAHFLHEQTQRHYSDAMRILAALLLLLASLPLTAATGTPAPPQGAESNLQLTQCMSLQGSLSRQTTALAELQAHSQALSSQRELERMRNESRIQALENEKARLLSAAVIAVLILLLAAATSFGLLLRKRHQQLRRLSEVDVLTGLGNRRAATRKLDALAAQRGPDGTRHVLFLIDVDHFKQINDSHGHHVGDEVLVALAAKLRAACRPTDLVARWGGEEFLVACTSLTREQAEQVAARLRRAMAYTLETSHAARLITVSLGLAPIPFFDSGDEPSPASCWDYALRMADRALYAAKRHRDAWVGYWGAQLPDNATAEAVLEQPEAADGIVTVMSSVPRIVSTSSAAARARSLKALRAQG
ncbi:MULTISPECIES: GGDEF domain-containing protein [Thermomonas]|uniref:GGDEF domain-containing protein n=1 Tax=Thermomonas TaxID=141948 RepID=UPI00048B2FDD|nr:MULTISPECIES: GGDEF domain-containing protein [Thermomonas]